MQSTNGPQRRLWACAPSPHGINAGGGESRSRRDKTSFCAANLDLGGPEKHGGVLITLCDTITPLMSGVGVIFVIYRPTPAELLL